MLKPNGVYYATFFESGCLLYRFYTDREAVDGTNEQIRRQSVVPTHGGDMSPPYRGGFADRGAFSRVDCEERSAAVAQPFATKERYGCGIPLTGTILYMHLR